MERNRLRLPRTVTVELLRHMSQRGRFSQTLSEFPGLDLDEVRTTFAWLAEQIGDDSEERIPVPPVQALVDFKKMKGLSAKTKSVLAELAPEDQIALLRNFGALEHQE